MNMNEYVAYDTVNTEFYKNIANSLYRLKRKLVDPDNLQARVTFAYKILNYYLFDELKSDNSLLAKYDLSLQDLDYCFEMGDGDEVAIDIMKKAVHTPILAQAIKDQLGHKLYENWLKISYQGQLSFF